MAIEKRRSKDGQISYRIRIRKEGHNVSETFPTLKQARAREKEVEELIASGRLLCGHISDHTLKDALERFTEELKTRRPNTQRGYRISLKYALKHFGEGRLVRTITPIMVHDYGLLLQKTYKRGSPCQYLLVFKQLLRRMFVWEWIPDDIARKVANLSPSPIIERCLKPDELKRLLEALDIPRCQEHRNIVLLALYTGMRRTELLGLQWHEVDLERRLIRLPAERCKTNKARNVPLCDDAVAVLLVQRKRHPDITNVFYSARNKPLRDVGPILARACKRAGIDGFRFHDLRHTAASYLAQAGANTFRVAQFLGHRDLATVQRYAHLNEEELHDSAKLIANKVSIGLE